MSTDVNRAKPPQDYGLKDPFICYLFFQVFSNLLSADKAGYPILAGNYHKYSLSCYLHLQQGCAVIKLCIHMWKIRKKKKSSEKKKNPQKKNPQTIPN